MAESENTRKIVEKVIDPATGRIRAASTERPDFSSSPQNLVQLPESAQKVIWIAQIQARLQQEIEKRNSEESIGINGEKLITKWGIVHKPEQEEIVYALVLESSLKIKIRPEANIERQYKDICDHFLRFKKDLKIQRIGSYILVELPQYSAKIDPRFIVKDNFEETLLGFLRPMAELRSKAIQTADSKLF